jgi:fucose 4-O-acetylase-like acetyltransferase
MRKPEVNLVIDIFAFVSFLTLVSTGILMYLVLPPGSGKLAVWGMTRHTWGDVHFWVAVLFLILITLHLIFHWKWIRCMFKEKIIKNNTSLMRTWLFIVAAILLLALVTAPLLSPVG